MYLKTDSNRHTRTHPTRDSLNKILLGVKTLQRVQISNLGPSLSHPCIKGAFEVILSLIKGTCGLVNIGIWVRVDTHSTNIKNLDFIKAIYIIFYQPNEFLTHPTSF